MKTKKLRAWDIKNKKMIKNAHLLNHLEMYLQDEQYVFMELTELKDESHGEVFEGDVVIGGGEDEWVIVWTGFCWAIKDIDGDGYCSLTGTEGDDLRYYKVIGNIFEKR